MPTKDKTEEKVRSRMMKMGVATKRLLDDTNELIREQNIFFPQSHSLVISWHSYLKTWMELEKTITVTDEQKKKIIPVNKAMHELIPVVSEAMGNFVSKKEGIFNLTNKFADCMSYLSKNISKISLCEAKMDEYESFYQKELKVFTGLKEELVRMKSNYEKAVKLFNELKE